MPTRKCRSAPLRTVLLLAALVGGWGNARAHGVILTQDTRSDLDVVETTAAFDTGEPMAGAPITVFSPRHPAHAWLTGRADRDGRFRFVPDPEYPGYWTVRVREEGHGATISIEVPGSED